MLQVRTCQVPLELPSGVQWPSEGRAEAEKIFKEMQMPSPYMLYLCAAVCQGPYCKRIWKLDV